MSQIELSFIVAGIRPEKWLRFVQCTKASFSGIFEVIFIGPDKDLPENLKGYTNIRFIHDMGSPVRCSQRAACAAVGEYISVCADDMFFMPGMIDEVFGLINQYQRDKKFVVSGKYYEGTNPKSHKVHRKHQYYTVNNSPVTRSPYIPNDWLILNIHFMKHNYYMEIGGQDARFEGQAMSLTDLANRVQNDGGKIILPGFVLAELEWLPGTGGDHSPVVESQIQNDEPLYQSIYRSPECRSRIKIDPHSWTMSPELWERRFGKK